jgi:hypothetical protein
MALGSVLKGACIASETADLLTPWSTYMRSKSHGAGSSRLLQDSTRNTNVVPDLQGRCKSSRSLREAGCQILSVPSGQWSKHCWQEQDRECAGVR